MQFNETILKAYLNTFPQVPQTRLALRRSICLFIRLSQISQTLDVFQQEASNLFWRLNIQELTP